MSVILKAPCDFRFVSELLFSLSLSCFSLSFQLNALSRENDGLRRQLEEERSMQQPPAPPPCQRCQIRTSIPVGRCDRYPNQAQGAGLKSLGEALDEEFPTGSSGGDQTK